MLASLASVALADVDLRTPCEPGKFVALWNNSRAAAEKRRATNAAFTVSLDDAEEIYRREASSELNAEELYEKRWALAVVVSATSRLRAEFAQAGRAEVFEVLQQYLVGESDTTYAETAERLGMNEGAVKTAIHRLRKRLGGLRPISLSSFSRGSNERPNARAMLVPACQLPPR